VTISVVKVGFELYNTPALKVLLWSPFDNRKRYHDLIYTYIIAPQSFNIFRLSTSSLMEIKFELWPGVRFG